MIRRTRSAALAWLAGAFALGPCGARAQAPRAQVVVTGSAVSARTFEILADAFAQKQINATRAATAPQCAGTLRDTDVRARVWLQWTPNSLARLCFRDHCASASRTLGPFARLDARAREELITVIESGLAALSARCPPQPLAAPDHAATSAPGPAPGSARQDGEPGSSGRGAAGRSTAHAATGGSATQPSPASGAGAPRAPPPSPVHATKAPPPGAGSALPSPHHAATAPSAEATREARPHEPPSAGTEAAAGGSPPEAVDAEPGSASPAGARLALGASYGLLRFGGLDIAQLLSGSIGYAMAAGGPTFLAFEVAYVLPFEVRHDGLGIDARSLRLSLLLQSQLSLGRWFALDARLGPAVEWLSLTPDAATAARVNARRSSSHADPWLVARVGPALSVLHGLHLGLDLGVDVAWARRSFGFVDLDTGARRVVFAPDQVRLSIALGVRAAL